MADSLFGEILEQDGLKVGRWLSELSPDEAKAVKKELKLPIKKDLVYMVRSYARPERSSLFDDISNRNGSVKEYLVTDLRVVEKCPNCGMVTLEIVANGIPERIRILAPYLESMQHGANSFLNKLDGTGEE